MKRVLALGTVLMLSAAIAGCGEAAQKKAWQLAFVTTCKAQSSEAWMEPMCNCVADKALAQFTIDQLKDQAKITEFIQQNIVACMPHDQMAKQWKETFVNTCVEKAGNDDKIKAYCECAAEKATAAWTNEQLADENFIKENIEKVSADCPKP